VAPFVDQMCRPEWHVAPCAEQMSRPKFHVDPYSLSHMYRVLSVMSVQFLKEIIYFNE
jgi:hypothetical protein